MTQRVVVAVLAAIVGGFAVGVPQAVAGTASALAPQPVAGYLISEADIGQASVRFTVPTVTCTSTVPSSGAILGAELIAPQPLVAGFEISCTGNTALYTGVFVTGGSLTPIPGSVKPGDVVTAWVKQAVWTKDGKLFNQANIANLTEGGGASMGGNQVSTVTEAAVGVIGLDCAANGCAPVAPFTKVSFASAKLNGTNLAESNLSAIRSLAGTVEAKAGPFDLTSKSHFTVSWVSTCATPDSNNRC